MKHKSLPAVLLAVLLCICTLCVPVYAASATEGGLTVTLTADKTSYRQDEPIAVTLTVTNNHDAAITGVALECGFYDASHFIHAFSQLEGCTPSDYRALNYHKAPYSVCSICG